MKVDTMRRIDHWAGVPLCAAATLFVRLRDSFRPRASRPVRRILFVELSEMGTTILAEPAMRKAGALFVIFARNVGSLQLLGTFPPDNIFTISDRSDLLARPRHAFIPVLDPARGNRHRRRFRIVFALHRPAARTMRRGPSGRLLPLPQRGALSR